VLSDAVFVSPADGHYFHNDCKVAISDSGMFLKVFYGRLLWVML